MPYCTARRNAPNSAAKRPGGRCQRLLPYYVFGTQNGWERGINSIIAGGAWISVMIEVLRIFVNKERLRAMPKNERALFLLLGYAANQINMLSKLIIFSTNKTPDEQPEQAISGAQSQMIARLIIGVLHESWELIRKRFLGSRLGKDYTPLLDPGGQAALAALKKNFGSSNLLCKLRGNYVFHHPLDADIEAAFDAAAADPNWDRDWNWFFSKHNFNSFYFASDLVILHGILNTIGETDLIAAQERLMAEVRDVSENMSQFIMALTAAFWRKRFGPDMAAEICARVEDAPDAFDVWIPFFVEIPEEEPPVNIPLVSEGTLSIARTLLQRSQRRIN
jgi:hypothetical protein